MKDIIVNTKWDKEHCHFHSVEEMVEYHINKGHDYNVKFALRDVMQCNIEYRNYLRENGYEATVEKIKSVSPSLARINDAFSVVEKWWKKTEENGELGNYDIQCYELGDAFTLLGERFNGLEYVSSIVNASARNESGSVEDRKWGKYYQMSEEERYPDNRKNKKSSLFAAELWESYPCFDISDYLYENRYFRCYYVRNHKINEEFFKYSIKKNLLDMVKEDIDHSELPMIYYDGESPVMYVMSERVIDAEFVDSNKFTSALKSSFGSEDVMAHKSEFERYLKDCEEQFLETLKPMLYSFVHKSKPMVDAGALFYALKENLSELPECAVRKWCGPIRLFYHQSWLQQAVEWQQEQTKHITQEILSRAQNLPEVLSGWSLNRGFEFVNSIFSQYKGCFEEKRSSWPASAITSGAGHDWQAWFSMVEDARDWLASSQNKSEVKVFDVTLMCPLMVDVVELEFRWDEDKLSITIIAKDYSSGMQCRKGIFYGSLEDAVKLMFSKDIISVLIYKGLRND